ncbi:SMP-30/gluconolactonase/LRE family protein [Derxia gummosa]|uniref:SMP-30/gluconolactonase/LRE family protein n=1 Tax=Derxia gummosa DSM 723 TaxID=1121388 RepID=A0A8B6XA19_9BURK|nr:SMP-30/gluconolactonase/LRE family protein [Derxia gummosa]
MKTLAPLLAALSLAAAPAAFAQSAASGAVQVAQATPPAPAANDSGPAVTPAIPGVVAAGTRIELIKEGFNGTEGPTSLPDGSLIFTETNAARITRIAADGGTSTFLGDSNGANGLALRPDGELYAVQVHQTRVGIVHPPEKRRTLADQFEGKGFGRPNDLVVDKAGVVYFTDSGPNLRPGESLPANINPPAVYRIGGDGKLSRIASGIERPNGIQLSPDEKTLYVANTNGEHILAFDIRADGSLGPARNFARLDGFRRNEQGTGSSGADGLAVDAEGRLYVASNPGIQVFSPSGAPLGTIALPRQPQNLAFAGPGKNTLYVVGRGAAYRIATLTAGYAGRNK